MHTMWKGSISFGLVNIPIKLHAATENKDVKFRQLHKECQTPIKYKKECPVCEREVGHDEIVKAYEYSKNKFVVLDEEDLAELKEASGDKSVEILDFVELDEIDPIYFEKSYYLSPNDGGSKAYALLRQALQDSGKIGVAKIILRSKEQLAAIRIYQNTLVMETIHYPDEVRSADDVPNIPESENIVKKELDTAVMLIDQLTKPFEPGNYQDDYRNKLLSMIEHKKNNEDVTIEAKQPKQDNVTNLMDALEASVDKANKSKAKNKSKSKKKTSTSKKAK
ncbi:Ku protein [Thalassobacillus sp. CUG 92003]|uniref:non-homologous end joining protein Ku n=1 Tax=Thalassobacillus sp. CUG 92003 TaxID=2736641 RepID=UPI0015E7B396|nr:Ku protein [Thalassobacillus sp. CUG 92003]